MIKCKCKGCEEFFMALDINVERGFADYCKDECRRTANNLPSLASEIRADRQREDPWGLDDIEAPLYT